MDMDRYLEKTLSGQQGKLICQGCGRLMSVLTKIDGKYFCYICEKLVEENDE